MLGGPWPPWRYRCSPHQPRSHWPARRAAFDPGENNNTVTINLPETIQQRYIQVKVTQNTGWPAAQVAEFEAYEK